MAIAIPAHQRLSQRGTNSAFVYCCLGAVTGAAPFVLIFVFTVLAGLSRIRRTHRFDFSESFWLAWALIGLVYGIISAIAFWSWPCGRHANSDRCIGDACSSRELGCHGA